MGKKKNNSQPINIQNLNMEIDYDKLAESIIKAQTVSQNKKKSEKHRSAAMRFFNGAIYGFVYILAVAIIYVIWTDCYINKTIPVIGCILFSLVFIFVGIYAFLCQQESHDDSASDAITHFNTNVTLIALIVAMIALFKGVS